jgi:hypothetical protein
MEVRFLRERQGRRCDRVQREGVSLTSMEWQIIFAILGRISVVVMINRLRLRGSGFKNVLDAVTLFGAHTWIRGRRMTDATTRLTLRVSDERADPQELDELTAGLRRELLSLDVDSVEPLRAGDPPAGTRGMDLTMLGVLVTTIATPELLASVVAAVGAWLAGRGQRAVKVEVDGDVLELTGLSSRQQQQFIDEWLRRRVQR